MSTLTPIREEYLMSVMEESKANQENRKPDVLTIETTDRVSKLLWLPPVMTYEGIILMNPLGTDKQLTYSQNETDKVAELFFYQTHKNIEQWLYPMIQWLLKVWSNKTLSTTDIVQLLQTAQNQMNTVLETMVALYKNLDKEAFTRFRGYFSSVKFRELHGVNYPGPSWASSAIFPTLDTLFGIEQIQELSVLASEIRPKIAWMWYTTIADIDRATDIVKKNWNLLEQFSENPEISAQLKELINMLRKFRINHRSHVTKYIPEAMNQHAPWTGGAQDVPTYLGQIIENTDKARQ